jgi:hypothetical protein
MPTSAKAKRRRASDDRATEMFYWKDGRRADAAIHEDILNEGNQAAAQAVSRGVGKRLGMSDETLNRLFGKRDR